MRITDYTPVEMTTYRLLLTSAPVGTPIADMDIEVVRVWGPVDAPLTGIIGSAALEDDGKRLVAVTDEWHNVLVSDAWGDLR